MRKVWFVVGTLLVFVIGGIVYSRLAGGSAGGLGSGESAPAPVEVASVEHGPIELRRTFSGTLESPAEFDVASRVNGRIVKLNVDVADPVRRGQVVAVLDDDEYVQAVAQAEAELALARANLTEARNSYEIARRELDRMSELHKRGVASDSQLDAATAQDLAKEAAVAVSQAQLTRAEAALESARIRLGYTKVLAKWTGGDDLRVVGERYVNEGDTVAPNTRLLSIIELDPIHAVVYVTEKDYGRLQPGQAVTLSTDAYPGEAFEGKVTRIAPVFRQSSRQARIEVVASNPEGQLKPGMFVRAEVVLDHAEDATIVPVAALTKRGGQTGVFLVSGDGQTVSWQTIEPGIRQDERVQVIGGGISGRVVTLGQQLIDDNSPITIPETTMQTTGEVTE